MTPKSANSDLFTRLSQTCNAVIKGDKTNEKGSKQFMLGNTNLLVGFDFSPDSPFNAIMRVPYTHDINRVAGTVSINLPEFNPEDGIRYPEKATHFRLKMGVAVLDFAADDFTFTSIVSAEKALHSDLIAADTLTVNIPANTATPVFIALAMEFLVLDDDELIPIRSSKFNPMKITAVDFPE